MSVRLEHGDMREVLARLLAEGVTVQSVVCDPPYHLTSIVKRFGGAGAAPAKAKQTGAYTRASRGFMGKQWDGGDIAFQPETWRLCFDLLPPGGHLLAFSGTRTYHRMACAIEDAGFEIRDMVSWIYGSGFPKSHNVSKGIDKMNGDVRPVVGEWHMPGRGKRSAQQEYGLTADRGEITSAASAASAAWEGWGTALKPALEPICLARKPLSGTVAGNVLQHRTGALNIDACRVGFASKEDAAAAAAAASQRAGQDQNKGRKVLGEFNNGAATIVGYVDGLADRGRWPANVVHDGSEEVLAAFPNSNGAQGALTGNEPTANGFSGSVYGYGGKAKRALTPPRWDTGSAGRFFYSAKADAGDRLGSKHPTVKPVDLMRWLARLITPPGGVVLDPFAGSGTTGMACMAEGFDCILVEREAEYVADIRRRIAHVGGGDTPLFGGDTPPPKTQRQTGLRRLRGRKIGPVGLRT